MFRWGASNEYLHQSMFSSRNKKNSNFRTRIYWFYKGTLTFICPSISSKIWKFNNPVDVTLNYKYTFGPHGSPLSHPWTYIITNTLMKQGKWLNSDLIQENHKLTAIAPTTSFDSQVPLIWNTLWREPSFSLRTNSSKFKKKRNQSYPIQPIMKTRLFKYIENFSSKH